MAEEPIDMEDRLYDCPDDVDPIGKLVTWIIWHDWTEEELKQKLQEFRRTIKHDG